MRHNNALQRTRCSAPLKATLDGMRMLLGFLACAATASTLGAESFTGFWKPSCGDAFGVQIKPAGNGIYSLSFCGPGGCFAPGTWAPNSQIVGDPKYKVISPTQLGIRRNDSSEFSMYTKCSDDPSAVAADPSAPKSETTGRLRYKSYYKGVPDYEHSNVFSSGTPEAVAQLREALQVAPARSSTCRRGTVAGTVAAHTLKSNVCDNVAYSKVVGILAKLAPSLDPSRMTFRKVDLKKDGQPEALVEYVDLVGDENVKDPYLTLWLLSFHDNRVNAIPAGPFLVGDVLAALPFGQRDGHEMVFVRHQSCTECHPWIYITIVDFSRAPMGDAFRFNYSEDHKAFEPTIEYSLPGKGHSVDAEVETRVMKPSDKGPHLLQRFALSNGTVEWWAFTCKDLECDFDLAVGTIPAKYKPYWNSGRKL